MPAALPGVWALSCYALLDGSLCSKHWERCWAEFVARKKTHGIWLFNKKKNIFLIHESFLEAWPASSLPVQSNLFLLSCFQKRKIISLSCQRWCKTCMLVMVLTWPQSLCCCFRVIFYFFSYPFSFIYFHLLAHSQQCIFLKKSFYNSEVKFTFYRSKSKCQMRWSN